MEGTTRTGRGRGLSAPHGALGRLCIAWFPSAGASGQATLAPLRGGLVIGREQADCALVGRLVSRRHALVEDGFILRDLGSKNGTYLNGHRIEQEPLSDQDVVRVGDWVGVVASYPEDWIGQPSPTVALAEDVLGGPRTQALFGELLRVASSRVRVMLVGETGTGKEVLARELHRRSAIKGPLIAINCAAIPAQLAEAELFGYRKGAFSGAERPSLGHFRSAHGGTLFLDEIADLSSEIQAKLLRALEERQVTPLGQSTPEPADARIVSACQLPLHEVVERGAFRPDLYARLNGCELRIPPLRKRREEVCQLLARELARPGGRAPLLSVEALEQLLLYDWPMNIRELVQLSQRISSLEGSSAIVQLSHLPEKIATFAPRRDPPAPSGPSSESAPPSKADFSKSSRPSSVPRDELAQRFLGLLRETQGNLSVAAERLGISRPRAYRLLRRLPEADLAQIRLENLLQKARSLEPMES